MQAQGLAGLHQRGCGPLVFAIAVGPGLVVAAVYAEAVATVVGHPQAGGAVLVVGHVARRVAAGQQVQRVVGAQPDIATGLRTMFKNLYAAATFDKMKEKIFLTNATSYKTHHTKWKSYKFWSLFC